eukprot:1156662-Pelagomonas_calceolata.AAC.16
MGVHCQLAKDVWFPWVFGQAHSALPFAPPVHVSHLLPACASPPVLTIKGRTYDPAVNNQPRGWAVPFCLVLMAPPRVQIMSHMKGLQSTGERTM